MDSRSFAVNHQSMPQKQLSAFNRLACEKKIPDVHDSVVRLWTHEAIQNAHSL
jgi:hypothetical protein